MPSPWLLSACTWAGNPAFACEKKYRPLSVYRSQTLTVALPARVVSRSTSVASPAGRGSAATSAASVMSVGLVPVDPAGETDGRAGETDGRAFDGCAPAASAVLAGADGMVLATPTATAAATTPAPMPARTIR